MSSLTLKLGANLGNLLLEIAQENILDGEPEKAINLYTQSLPGITEEIVIKLLKNEGVLVTDNDTLMFTDDPDLLEKNKIQIYDWDHLMNHMDENLKTIRRNIIEYSSEFFQNSHININDFNLKEWGIENDDDYHFYHLAAKMLAGEEDDNPTWDAIRTKVELGEATRCEKVYYYLINYVFELRCLLPEYVNLANSYKWLLNNGLVKHIPFIENCLEHCLVLLDEFADLNTGYYHPMCDEAISNFKEEITDSIMKTEYGKEFFLKGALQKNIMDGYDAGWLSPEGEFFASLGSTSDFIHMKIAEKLFKGRDFVGFQMRQDGVSSWGLNSPERYLENKGWLKIHHNDIYGYFHKTTPTPIQIKMICDYADRHCNGKFYTEAGGFGKRISHPDPYSTYQVRQMDKPMLHKIFKL